MQSRLTLSSARMWASIGLVALVRIRILDPMAVRAMTYQAACLLHDISSMDSKADWNDLQL